MIFIGATYEVACYTTQHIHNNCCRFQNFPFKCFEIVSLALHMLIPRLMMRKAQIYRIQNLNIFRFCHTAPLPHSGADFPFNILNILGVTPLHREFWNVYLNMSRAIEIYPYPLSISMDMRVFGSIQPHAICPARALRALGLLLADGAPTVGGGKTFWAVSRIFLRKQL